MKRFIFGAVFAWGTMMAALLIAQEYIYDGESYFERLGGKVIKNYEKICYDGFEIWGEGGIGISLPYYGKIDYVVKLSYISEKNVTIYQSEALYTHAVIVTKPKTGEKYLVLGSNLEDMANDLNR